MRETEKEDKQRDRKRHIQTYQDIENEREDGNKGVERDTDAQTHTEIDRG